VVRRVEGNQLVEPRQFESSLVLNKLHASFVNFVPVPVVVGGV